jgi:hypothetical protein
MLELLNDNIFIFVGEQVFQQSVGKHCATVLADLFLYLYVAEFMQKLLHKKKKSCGS